MFIIGCAFEDNLLILNWLITILIGFLGIKGMDTNFKALHNTEIKQWEIKLRETKPQLNLKAKLFARHELQHSV